jgi:hypothetical protein
VEGDWKRGEESVIVVAVLVGSESTFPERKRE